MLFVYKLNFNFSLFWTKIWNVRISGDSLEEWYVYIYIYIFFDLGWILVGGQINKTLEKLIYTTKII